MDQLLRTALVQRLGEHLRATVDPLADLAGVGQQSAGERALTGLRLGTLAPRALVDALGLAREGLDYGSKVGTGGLLAANAEANPFLKLFPDSPGAHLAQQALAGFLASRTGNPIGRLRESNEVAAAENPLATGALNVATDPSSYLTGGGTAEARAAQQAGRIGRGLGLDLNLVNQILSPEGQVLEALGGKVAGKVGARLSESALTNMLRERYGSLLGDAPGAKEYGAYAKQLGLPAPGKVAQEPSDLAPAKANIRQLLREANARAKTGAQTDLFAPVEQAEQASLTGLLGTATPEATPGADPLGLMREVLRGGDGGRHMVYVPTDPAFWAKRAGVDEAAVPGLLGQLRDEGSVIEAGDELINPFRAGGSRAGGSAAAGGTAGAAPGETVATGPLTSDELDRLVNIAYPGREAQANAILKYPNPDDLTEAALNRLGQSPDVLHAFAAQYPDLAQRLVDLPDPRMATEEELAEVGADVFGLTARLRGEPPRAPADRAAWQRRYVGRSQAGTDILGEGDRVGAGALTQADLNALPPQERMAYLRRLAGGDESGIAPMLGQGAGRWLTRSLTQGGPPVTRLGVAGSGGLAGLAAGGLAPADSDEDRRRNMLTGAALGGGLGLGTTTRQGNDILRQLPKVAETARTLGGEAWQAQRAAMGRESKGLKALGDVGNVWSVQTTSTLRNLLQSAGSLALWLKDAGVRLGAFRENMASLTDLYNLGVRKPYDAQPQATTAILDALGKTGREIDLGKTFNDVNRNMLDNLSAIDTALIEGGLAAANPLYGGVPVLGVAAGAAKGYFRPALQKVYNTLDNFIELAARHAAWEDEVTPALRVAASDFLDRHGLAGALPDDGLFSAKDVERLAGQAAGQEWDGLADRAIKLGEERSKAILGDFGNRSQLERLAGKGVPFIGWAVRAYPRTLKMALDHPGASAALMTLMFNAAAGARESGLPGYQVGTLPVSQDTPVLGGVAKALTGGQPGEMRLNLVSGLSPVGGSVLEGDDLPEDPTGYQQAKNVLGRTGFSFSPIVTMLMYALNQDFAKPGPLSRTALGETILPGPQVPSLLAGPLNKAREAAGGSVSTATPHDRKLAEIFYRETGHLISDPTNMQDPQRRALLMQTLDPESEIRRQADAEMRTSGAAKLAISLASPVTATARSDQQAATQQARQEVAQRPPAAYDQGAIRAARRGGTTRDLLDAYLMERANAGTQGDLPDDLLIPQGASGQDRAAAIMDSFQNSYYGGGYYQNYLLQQLLGLR